MDKLLNMTVDELLELGYGVKLSKHDFADEDKALEGFKGILSEGSAIRSTTILTGSTWLSADYLTSGLELDIIHFVKKPKFIHQENDKELVL